MSRKLKMTAKQFFRQCRREIKEYQYMRERLEWLRGTLLLMAIRYKPIDVQSSGAGDQMAEIVPEIVALERTIAEYVEKLAGHQRQAERMIGMLDRPEYRMLLRLYYLHEPLLSWEEVAERMHYELQTVYNMHGAALLAIAELSKSK